MSVDHDAEVKRIANALAEIAHALGSTGDAAARVERVLRLTHELVPYAECALLEVVPGLPQRVQVLPDVPPEARDAIRARLLAVLDLFSDDDAHPAAAENAGHLMLPLMGLDQVVGVLRVRPPGDVHYEAKHLRFLSVVAAQLGAYLTLIGLHADQERQKRDLAVVNEVQRNLVAIVSHDLRTPLSVITSVASSLLPKATDQRQAGALERALRNARRATRIINDLLDVTHTRATGGIPVAPRRIDLRGLLREVVDDARAANPDQTIVFDDGVGAPIAGWWDPDRLSQLVMNLIGNALSHGDRTRPMSVTLAAAAGAATVGVHNHGNPIRADLIPTLFDPFTRAGFGRHRGGGVGLGLYIVDQIARAHGSTVQVSSDEVRGTSFTVCLPTGVDRAP